MQMDVHLLFHLKKNMQQVEIQLHLQAICANKINRQDLWTVPTFASEHTFCATHRPWFKHNRHTGLTLMQSTTLPST